MIKRILVYFLICCMGLFMSCKSDWYDIPGSTEPYIQAFDSYAKQRGYEFDFEETGLIVEFSDLGEDTVARCNYEDPIRIELDADTWEQSNDDRREAIMMRYMALGFLNRQNTNNVFPNGEWTSLMRGRPYDVDATMYNTLNYFGFRKEYYIDELFSEKTEWPWWADHETSYDSLDNSDFETIIEEQFLNGSEPWSEVNVSLNTEMANGELILENNSNDPKISLYNLDADINNNFKIECIVKIEGENPSAFNGLIWGAADSQAYYFSGYNMQHDVMMANEKANYEYFTFHFGSESVADFSNYNKITVYHYQGMVYVFLNQDFIYLTDIHQMYGDHMGFRVDANSTLVVDRLIVAHVE
ncbi:MAG: hypothetical protein R6V32_02515 [Bacteroidales bacterium]